MSATPHHHQVVDFLQFGFPVGFEEPVSSPSYTNHASARDHPRDVASYICTDIQHGAILEPFSHPPFTPWCQTSPLLTPSQKGNSSMCVILEMSWSLPTAASVNGGTPRGSYLGAPKKMQMPSAKNFTENICKLDRRAWMYSADISRSYCQLPLDPMDLPLI